MAESELKEIVNVPVRVKAFGREYEVKRFALGKLSRALEHIAPLGYLMNSVGQSDMGVLLAQALRLAGDPALGLISVAIDEPVEWLEDKDPIEGFELLTTIVEVNARYFFDSANLDRLKAAGNRIQTVIEKHGGDTSKSSSTPITAP
jgi:hypothetical protein